jgi:serine/threonine-protein kinase HipA
MHPRRIKMAMNVHSKNTQYHWHKIHARHWLSHAKHLGLPESEMKTLLVELCKEVPDALTRTSDPTKNMLNMYG